MIDSPLTRDDSMTSRLIASAPRRIAASSNEARVRVEGSAKRFATVQPAELVAARRELAGRAQVGLRPLQQLLDQAGLETVERDQVAQPAIGVELRERVSHRAGSPGCARSHCSSRMRAASRSTSPRRTRRVLRRCGAARAGHPPPRATRVFRPPGEPRSRTAAPSWSANRNAAVVMPAFWPAIL